MSGNVLVSFSEWIHDPVLCVADVSGFFSFVINVGLVCYLIKLSKESSKGYLHFLLLRTTFFIVFIIYSTIIVRMRPLLPLYCFICTGLVANFSDSVCHIGIATNIYGMQAFAFLLYYDILGRRNLSVNKRQFHQHPLKDKIYIVLYVLVTHGLFILILYSKLDVLEVHDLYLSNNITQIRSLVTPQIKIAGYGGSKQLQTMIYAILLLISVVLLAFYYLYIYFQIRNDFHNHIKNSRHINIQNKYDTILLYYKLQTMCTFFTIGLPYGYVLVAVLFSQHSPFFNLAFYTANFIGATTTIGISCLSLTIFWYYKKLDQQRMERRKKKIEQIEKSKGKALASIR